VTPARLISGVCSNGGGRSRDTARSGESRPTSIPRRKCDGWCASHDSAQFSHACPTTLRRSRRSAPAAIKLGQTLATRPDLVGDEAAHNLLTLQDSLPPVPFPLIEKELSRAFERPIGDVFAEIDPVAVGSASIAQVHKGVTPGGRTVAIKVLRPGIRERFAQDIDTYEWAAAQLEGFGGEARRLRPRLTIANFKRWTNSELDLRREAASASELAEAMKGFEAIASPRSTGTAPTAGC
jgi:ubiquinone biosynthesis protein